MSDVSVEFSALVITDSVRRISEMLLQKAVVGDSRAVINGAQGIMALWARDEVPALSRVAMSSALVRELVALAAAALHAFARAIVGDGEVSDEQLNAIALYAVNQLYAMKDTP